MGDRGAVESRWLMVFLFLTASLASTIVLKIAQIQYLELIYFVELTVLAGVLYRNGFRMRWFRPFLSIAISYSVFAAIAFALALCALRYDFYFPGPVSILKYPVIITISRILELFASVAIMLYIAGKLRSDRNKAAFTMRVYFWVGCISAIFSIISYPLNRAGIIDLGTYGAAHRMRGFYNEGGPYGLYLFSVLVVGFALYRHGWIKKRSFLAASSILGIAFLGSKSKAAFCAVLFLLIVNGLLAKSVMKRAAIILAMCTFVFAVYQVVDFGALVKNYQRLSEAYEWLSHRHSKDPNFVAGRVAGAFLVPRMVEAHPIAGVGWGNYGLLRDAPEYRGAAAFAPLNDEPGLGVAGMSAELGLPLVFYLVICLLLPFFFLRRIKAPLYIVNLALLQPLVHLFGGQLNLTYPWIVTSFALGLGYSIREKHTEALDTCLP